jgi:hypothetical protein
MQSTGTWGNGSMYQKGSVTNSLHPTTTEKIRIGRMKKRDKWEGGYSLVTKQLCTNSAQS